LLQAVLSYHVTTMRTFRALASFGRGATITLATLARNKTISTISEWVARGWALCAESVGREPNCVCVCVVLIAR
jgi:hypothetical protein